MAVIGRAFAALALAILLPDALSSQAREGASRHVILISIDGFAAFHLDNRAIDLPNIRALAAAGARASQSESVFPSLTHPSHTTLTTGVTPREHGVVGNRVRDRQSGERFHITNLPRRQSIRVPTIFDAVHAKGLRTAAFFWPETRDDSAIDDNFAEVFDASDMADPGAVSPALLAELRGAGVPIDSYFAYYDDPFGQGAADLALTRAAAHVFKARKPALTAVHLLVADKVQHEVGAAHYLSAAALTTADHCVGLLRKAVDEAGLGQQTTFIVAADHGFTTVAHELNVAPLLKDPILDNHVRWHADGWFVFGEVLPSFDAARHQPALERVLDRVRRAPGVGRVVRPGEFGALGYPEYVDNLYVPGHYLIAADVTTHLVLDEKNATAERRPRQRPYHGHGYFADHPSMQTALVFSGAGISRGVSLGQTKNVDVAPTIAALLGVELPTAIGRVLIKSAAAP
jgi:predicted AlkP superfamily pyrophosphatase or phosphodiesterase